MEYLRGCMTLFNEGRKRNSFNIHPTLMSLVIVMLKLLNRDFFHYFIRSNQNLMILTLSIMKN